jgi:deoxyribonuclease V
MKPVRVHSWNIGPDEATAIQHNLRDKVVITPISEDIRFVGATAVAFDTNKNFIHAALSVLTYPKLDLVEQCGISREIRFEYVSGLLAFREGGPLMSLFRKIENDLGLVVFHAHGQAHPRRFGLASHLGVLLDIPSIGISNKVLVGHHEYLPKEKFSESGIIYQSEKVGVALRTKEGVNPIFISTGHKADLSSSVQTIKRLVTNYRFPEPTRLAQLAANKQKEGGEVEINTGNSQTSLF